MRCSRTRTTTHIQQRRNSGLDYFVYWIHKTSDFGDAIWNEGYVGITTDVDKRFGEHSRSSSISNRHLKFALKKYQDIVEVETVFNGSKSECLCIEAMFRPQRKIGWNLAPGGGAPPKKSKKDMKIINDGVKQTWIHKDEPLPDGWSWGETKECCERRRNRQLGAKNSAHGKRHWINPRTGEKLFQKEAPEDSEFINTTESKKHWFNPVTGEHRRAKESPGLGFINCMPRGYKNNV